MTKPTMPRMGRAEARRRAPGLAQPWPPAACVWQRRGRRRAPQASGASPMEWRRRGDRWEAGGGGDAPLGFAARGTRYCQRRPKVEEAAAGTHSPSPSPHSPHSDTSHKALQWGWRTHSRVCTVSIASHWPGKAGGATRRRTRDAVPPSPQRAHSDHSLHCDTSQGALWTAAGGQWRCACSHWGRSQGCEPHTHSSTPPSTRPRARAAATVSATTADGVVAFSSGMTATA